MAIFKHKLKSWMKKWIAVDDPKPVCRICHGGSSIPFYGLHTCCYCSGSNQFVHRYCLAQWLATTAGRTCKLCGHDYRVVRSKTDYFEWLVQDYRLPYMWLILVFESLCVGTINLFLATFYFDCDKFVSCQNWPRTRAFLSVFFIFFWCFYIYLAALWVPFARRWWSKGVKKRLLVLDIV